MRSLEERLARLERLVSQMRFSGVEKMKPWLTEPEVKQLFGIGRERLKQFRLGHNGEPPVLFNWTSVKGRRIQYNTAELEKVLKRKKAKAFSQE